ncbi:twin-arginine translocase subunit TatC [Candidatus Paracaedibacter symbiosus]|uniref:twin-arginine translocase subunit TatC n=1 Tax=Candidatus Paracaedibacter symbiosus TaxID=244582 RepID=UPI000509CA6E|nr:twin-arginine translocase subunit TatC [Candidatus Paracaedibacter symbiosus]
MTQTSNDNRHQPVLAHLLELRKRFIYSIIIFALLTAACYPFAETIFQFLLQPLGDLLQEKKLERKLIYTGLSEAFITYLKISLFSGFFLSFPFIASQIWFFIAPGLYKDEKKILRAILVATPVLFIAGIIFAYKFIFPAAYGFFLSFETPGTGGSLPIQLEPRVAEYLSFVMKLLLAFGVSFELPVLISVCASVGLIHSSTLIKYWRIAIVIIFAIAAIVTPPDILSMIGLAVPLVALYGLSILMVKLIERRKNVKEADPCST